ncbi:related to TSR4-cytoplasmic protein required for correct processing of the 20S pre-rRNA [Sporisorium scitamineum]|uniref:Related to TSR4-cytoplasmic protein required for correct processing of the 20S pre-rRNA n=1 Tax=Sporisorium scitamineum TaxID=49012 RepID=A0A0F7S4K5_9BASI|nr:related to TSR4-cytoplasmic protein required for correct processing of the 20S pre-rRNA [Sporisorium scitamineum]CDW97321.1 hypothetical protein [Sporisorium scitamineum]
MPRPPSDDGYDSDSGSEFDASDVQLGLADGPLEGDDETNPLVSRIGGRAAWLPMKSNPTQDVAQCSSCKQQMQLLVQIFAPLVESPYDRCLMVWGCARPACQRKDVSSLRVIRTLKFNSRWAAKLEKQKAKRLAREQAKKEREAAPAKAKQEQEERAKINPFSAPTGGANAGLGGMLFGSGSDNPFAASAPSTAAETPSKDAESDTEDEDDDSADDKEESESERLAEELALKSDLAASQPTAESAWVESSTRYPPLYLNTVPEPSSSSISKKLSKEEATMLKSASASGALAQNDVNDADLKGFAKEGYEKMLLDGIDDTFERFLKRVSVEPRQAVRYEFGGEPIAFHAKGKIYDLLWPKEPKAKAGEGVAVTKSQFKTGVSAGERSFSARAVPPCPHCGSDRVFEAQLMPNLINLLKADQIQTANGSLDTDTHSSSVTAQDEEAKRKAAIEQALGRRLPSATGKDGAEVKFDARSGLVWSTAFVFVCSKDCCGSTEEQECWREEVVLAQFEDEQ